MRTPPAFQVYLDVDEVVFPFREACTKIARQLQPDLPPEFEKAYLGSPLLYLNQFQRAGMPGLPPQTTIPAFRTVLRTLGDSALFFNPPYPSARAFCEAVYLAGGIIQVITGRGTDYNAEEYYNQPAPKTERWLQRNALPYDELIISEDKEKHIRNLENEKRAPFRLAVDDRLDKLVDLVTSRTLNSHLIGILPDKPYNQARPGSHAHALEQNKTIVRVPDLFIAAKRLPDLIRHAMPLVSLQP